MSMTLIEHIEVTDAAGQAAIEFTSIPQTYTDLLVVISGRSDSAPFGNAFDGIYAKPNGTTANLSTRFLYGAGSGSGASGTGTQLSGGETSSSSSTASTFGSSNIYFPNYTSSNAKSFSTDGVSENNATSAIQVIAASLWDDTTAISSLEFTLESGTGKFVQYSSATLFGILAGSDGTTTVS